MITPQQFDANVGTPGYDPTGALTTAALTQAFAAADAQSGNDFVYCQAGNYPTLYPGSGAEFFLSRKSGLVGDGTSTQFFIKGSPPNVDWFRVQPASQAGSWTGLRIADFQVNHGDASPARNVIDCNGTLGGTMQAIVIERVRSQATVSHAGIVFSGTSAFQAPAASIIRDCMVYGAPYASILIKHGGDSIHIHDTLLSGAQYGILAWLIAGAGNLVIDGANNITGANAICIDGGTNITIADAEIESLLPNSPTGSVVSLRGAQSKIDTAVIRGVQVAQTMPHPPNGSILYLGKVDHATVQGRFGNYRGGSVIGVFNSADATNTVIEPSKFENCSTKIYDPMNTVRYASVTGTKPGWAMP